jgi:hypothetical protein
LPRLGRFAIAWTLLLFGAAAHGAAVDLNEQTARAYERYAEEITRIFLDRVHGVGRSSGIPTFHRDGEIRAGPGREDGIIGVPDGLVHHWIGSTFIAGITLEDALKVSSAYDDYRTFYKSVIASRLLDREGDTYRAQLRIRESAAGISAVLDITTRVRYFHPSPTMAYSVSTSTEVREVRDAGTPRERHLPAGRDSGYLWRVATLNRLVERDYGVFIEMETLGLSRRFPAMLGWIIEPIARRLGRKSVEESLQEFRAAVRARKR